LVDVPPMVAVWSNASLARDPSDSVVAVAYEDAFVVTARILLDASVGAMKKWEVEWASRGRYIDNQ
jgi:hypothetical protein